VPNFIREKPSRETAAGPPKMVKHPKASKASSQYTSRMMLVAASADVNESNMWALWEEPESEHDTLSR
jgi:hypothetical protein